MSVRKLRNSVSLGDLADGLRATMEARPSIGLYRSFALLLLQADEQGFDGLSKDEVESVFANLDPSLYGESMRTPAHHMLLNAKKMGIAVAVEGRWQPTTFTPEYLSRSRSQ